MGIFTAGQSSNEHIMKKLTATLLAAFAIYQVSAAEGDWLNSLPKALEHAKKEKKLVLLDFNGSDWCPPCIKLKKDVFGSADFKKFAKDNLVLVDVDFPRRKAQPADIKAANDALSEKYKIEGFPTIIVLNADGKEVNREVGYDGESPKDYVGKLKKLKK